MPEIIREGDKTSHDGTVLEGSPSDTCMGKPISYIGHKVYCPKCRGTFPIVEGVMSASFYGKGVAVAGMKTSCGAILIASQFTDTIEWSGGAAAATAAQQSTAAVAIASLASGMLASRASGDDGLSQQASDRFDEKSQLHGQMISGVPYFIETSDGRTFAGRAMVDGMLPRIETYDQEEYTVYWGDDALEKIEGAG